MSNANIIGGPAVRHLLKRATTGEMPVVERLAIAAGFLWKCGPRQNANGTMMAGCGTVNGDDERHCSKCYIPRKP